MMKTACVMRLRQVLLPAGVLMCLVGSTLSLSGCAWPFGESPDPASQQATEDEQNRTAEAAAPQTEAAMPQAVKQPVVQETPKTPPQETPPPTLPAPPAPVAAVPTAAGDLVFLNVNELLAASAQAEKAGKFLGDIEPFDAFPFLDGADTVGRAFKAGPKGELMVKYFAFHVPGKSFDRRVYGYLVDAGNGRVFGHFDTDADGIFDAHTLEPSLRFDLYEKVKPGQ
ncbi:hypothetical protein [Megalodesulfovibrio gigas]|uniref:Lipoprotein n=1 Tax=Megalodesulfovibrio gigas (strain ATCC 19364 / DSM 1382 / NCIMB 9332 / VKM B-1759) TaxID=1121448 RepID=T2G616_MEGG1|nr:hypothetical protein [Megalodesulfovibrio gigas]AGW12025.1 hypothetical protein DGI_0087 [Megalodesulfovibrio gigas DSM 1382 = ATCC 19364]